MSKRFIDGKEYQITGIINKKLNIEASKNWGFDIYDKDTITIYSLDFEKLDIASISVSSVELLLKNNNDNKNNIHSIQMDDNINYVYIINYLNKNQKYIENTKITLFPFHFYLSSLKNKIIYILEKNDHFYLNDSNVLRSYNFWRYE